MSTTKLVKNKSQEYWTAKTEDIVLFLIMSDKVLFDVHSQGKAAVFSIELKELATAIGIRMTGNLELELENTYSPGVCARGAKSTPSRCACCGHNRGGW